MNNLLRGSVGAAAAMFLVGTLAAISSVINQYPLYGGQALRYALAAVVLSAAASAKGLGLVRLTLRETLLLLALTATGLVLFTSVSSRPPGTPAQPWSARSSAWCR